METCKTCRWWDGDGRHDGHCRKADMIGCTLAGVPLNSGGVSVPMQGRFWWLATGPDFGCIHHQPKEPAHAPQQSQRS